MATKVLQAASILLLLHLVVGTAQAAASLKYSPHDYSATLRGGEAAKFSLTVTPPKGSVTAIVPIVTPLGGNPVPAEWVSSDPGEATFGEEGFPFLISISVPDSAAPGTYMSRVGARVVEGDAGDGVGCKVTLEVLPNEPPTAAFTWGPANPSAGDDVWFADASADADGEVVEWDWDFGDDTGSIEQHPVHRFAAEGEYVVTLTVTDDDGADDSCSVAVPVGAPVLDDPETVVVLYHGGRMLGADSTLQLGASAASIFGQDQSLRAGALITFPVLDSRSRVVAEPQACQAGPSVMPRAELSLPPGVYRIYVDFPGSGEFSPASAGPEFAVVSPVDEEALVGWGTLDDGDKQFALLISLDDDGEDVIRQFEYRDAASETRVTSTSVDAVTWSDDSCHIAGICVADGVHGHEFQVELAQADGAWTLTLDVSGELIAQGALDASSTVAVAGG